MSHYFCFTEIAEILINYGATVNEVDFYGQVPLYYAAEYGQLGMANLLIKSGIYLLHQIIL